MLDESDKTLLDELGLTYSVFDDPQPNGTWTDIIISGYQLPSGFDHVAVDMLVRLPPGFPDAAPDNFWIAPPIRIARTRAFPRNADRTENRHDRTWQFFSRHLSATPWRPGIDDLRSWLNIIRRSLEEDGK